jgi:RecA/RadA recombinase
MANKLLAKMMKEKAFADMLRTEQKPIEWLSTNCISVNLLLSGKIKGGIKKGSISMIAAGSGWGKSMIGYAVLKSAQDSGMNCFIVDTENSVNYDLLTKLGINMKEVGVFGPTNRIPKIKQFITKLMSGLTLDEARNTFLLFDSWGPIIEEQVIEKAEQASSAVNMSSAKFKNELANLLLSAGFTTLVMNHVYASLEMYGDPYKIPGGMRIIFNAENIMLGSSTKKEKDKDKNILGKVITAGVAKGRSAKEFVKTQYLILHAGGISPYYGLLDEAIDCGIVYKPKPGYYARIGYDVQVDKETGELGKPDRVWKESELYCAKFWIPLYKDETFRHYVEAKFAFEDQVLINASEDIMKLMEKEDADLSENTGIDPNVAASGEDEDYVDDED